MSGDETFLLLVSGGIALVAWTFWFRSILSVTSLASSWAVRRPVLAAPWVCALLLFEVLRNAAAHDVRDDASYLFLYEALGAAWIAIVAHLLERLGLSARDDVAERGNPAAAIAVCGALVGATLCFAGSNIGDGPGWWVVVFTAALATGAFVALWLLLDALGGATESVVVERDLASGVRLGGWFVAIGLVLGRAAAGNWTGADAAVEDFARLGWPALLLTCAAIVLERRLRPTPQMPNPSWRLAGLMPAALHVGVACAWVAGTRPWS